jgi:hypothetical protein
LVETNRILECKPDLFRDRRLIEIGTKLLKIIHPRVSHWLDRLSSLLLLLLLLRLLLLLLFGHFRLLLFSQHQRLWLLKQSKRYRVLIEFLEQFDLLDGLGSLVDLRKRCVFDHDAVHNVVDHLD